MERKLVLIGASSGPWVSIRGMRKPRARVRAEPSVKVSIMVTSHPDHAGQLHCGEGTHEVDLPENNWITAIVVDGSPESVLCVVESACA